AGEPGRRLEGRVQALRHRGAELAESAAQGDQWRVERARFPPAFLFSVSVQRSDEPLEPDARARVNLAGPLVGAAAEQCINLRIERRGAGLEVPFEPCAIGQLERAGAPRIAQVQGAGVRASLATPYAELAREGRRRVGQKLPERLEAVRAFMVRRHALAEPGEVHEPAELHAMTTAR